MKINLKYRTDCVLLQLGTIEFTWGSVSNDHDEEESSIAKAILSSLLGNNYRLQNGVHECDEQVVGGASPVDRVLRQNILRKQKPVKQNESQ